MAATAAESVGVVGVVPDAEDCRTCKCGGFESSRSTSSRFSNSDGRSQTESRIDGLKKKDLVSPVHTRHLQYKSSGSKTEFK